MRNDFIIQIISSASVSVLLSGLLVWIARFWLSERLKNSIKHEYDQKLEAHKVQLKAQADIEVEKLRSQLNILAAEHEIQFTRLHEKRAEVIAETYALLKNLYSRIQDYVAYFEFPGMPPKAERGRIAREGAQKFQDYYSTKLIFFPKGTVRNSKK